MKRIFTSNDLLRYVYKEMSTVEEKSIEKQLAFDASLSDSYLEILEGIALLQQAEVSPSKGLMGELRHKLKLNEEEHSV